MSCTRGCCETQRDHYRGVVFGVGPQPETLRERRLAKDLAAFKSATQTGARLRAIDGAAEITAQAQSTVEIERGHLIRNDRLRRELEQATREAPPPSVA